MDDDKSITHAQDFLARYDMAAQRGETEGVPGMLDELRSLMADTVVIPVEGGNLVRYGDLEMFYPYIPMTCYGVLDPNTGKMVEGVWCETDQKHIPSGEWFARFGKTIGGGEGISPTRGFKTRYDPD